MQVIENVLDAINVYLSRHAEYQDVIQLCHGIAIKQVPQDSIYGILECGLSIAETEWHHRIFFKH